MKTIKKTLISALCLMILTVGLTACDSSDDGSNSSSNTASQSTISVTGIAE